MTTVHAYTNDQVTLDIAHRKGIYSRRGRSAAQTLYLQQQELQVLLVL